MHVFFDPIQEIRHTIHTHPLYTRTHSATPIELNTDRQTHARIHIDSRILTFLYLKICNQTLRSTIAFYFCFEFFLCTQNTSFLLYFLPNLLIRLNSAIKSIIHLSANYWSCYEGNNFFFNAENVSFSHFSPMISVSSQ